MLATAFALSLVLACESKAVAQEKPDSARRTFVDIRSNMLLDVMQTPNVGVEAYVGRKISVGLNWNYAWWNNSARKRFWRIYGGDIYVRRWFGRMAEQKPLTGHHIGLYVQALTYDLEFGGKGYMGGEPGDNMFARMNYGIGVEYGFSLPVHRRLNIDFTVGIGYFGGKYYEYEPMDGHYVWLATRERRWFGPTKAEMSLVWLLGRHNINKKGGRHEQ